MDLLLLLWFAATALSLAYVAYDVFFRTPVMRIMRWGWLLVVLYTGPIGLVVYLITCQPPRDVSHEGYVAPLWRQAAGSTIHCLAGDATGVIAGAALTAVLASPMGIDLVIEYVAGFAFGLLIFQALFMKRMLGGSYVEAVRSTFLPEWISMNLVMAGMAPVMVILMTQDMALMRPTDPRFWGIMSLATLTGAVLAYPVNIWLVARGLKHGMGTDQVLGAAGRPATRVASAELEQASAAATGHDLQQSPGSGATGASRLELTVVTVLTLIALAIGVLLAGAYGDLSMSAHG